MESTKGVNLGTEHRTNKLVGRVSVITSSSGEGEGRSQILQVSFLMHLLKTTGREPKEGTHLK